MSELMHWRPFAPRLFSRTFDDVFSDLLQTPKADAQRARRWSPRVDVTENPEAYVIKAEVPGLDPADIELTLKENALILKGEKKSEEAREGESWHVVERSYGGFERVFRFPERVDAEGVSAKAEHGLLTIEVKKAPESQPRKIEVK